MGLYPQPNTWQCGPFALKHALMMLGKFVSEKEISRISGAHWWGGTDEIKLGRAARTYDCVLKQIRRKNPLRAKGELMSALKKGIPAILCVDGWNHWITVVGVEHGKFIYIDSREDPVVCVDSWTALRKRWVYEEIDEDDPTNTETLFDLHPVTPRFRTRTKARFSLKRVKYLRRPENRRFASHWDEYFNDLSSICTPRTPLSEKVFPMGELLRRHGAMIQAQISYWHGDIDPNKIKKMLQNFQFVADTYALVVRQADEKRAIVGIAAILTLWAASKFGVGEVYGNT
jgi:hypothetical protein